MKKFFEKIIRQKNHLQYSGPYKNWDEAKLKSVGYSSDVVLKKVNNAIKNVLDEKYAYERDGTNFADLPLQNTLINTLKKIDLKNKTVLDIGGGLGSLYINYKEIFFGNIDRYIVLEQDNFCNRGNELATKYDLPIVFNENIEEVDKFDIAIMSSSLQYFEEWHKFVEKLISRFPKYVLIDRHPLTDRKSEIFIQLNTNYYEEEVTYPIHILNEKDFLAAFNGYEVIKSWNSDFDPQYFKGFLLKILD